MNDDPLRQRLGQLPPAPLPGHLWPRLQARRRRSVLRRRWTAAAALAAVALFIALPRPVTAPPASVAEASQAVPPAAPDDAVAAIDRALQEAYSQGASDGELAPLWEIRGRLVAPPRPVSQPAGQS